jgi:hypothetical protein
VGGLAILIWNSVNSVGLALNPFLQD